MVRQIPLNMMRRSVSIIATSDSTNGQLWQTEKTEVYNILCLFGVI